MRCSMSLATACHPASRNLARTGTQESVCSLWGQLHIFSPPWKKKLLQKSGLSPTSQAITRWTQGRTERLRGLVGRERLAPRGWAGSVWGHTSFRSSVLRGKWPVHEQQAQRCQRIVLSLQEHGKPGANLTWFSPHGNCSPIQGCHSYATHWVELRWKLGLHSVSSHCLSLSKICPGF